MENYYKGKNLEEELSTGNIPINCLPEKYGWLLVQTSHLFAFKTHPILINFSLENSISEGLPLYWSADDD